MKEKEKRNETGKKQIFEDEKFPSFLHSTHFYFFKHIFLCAHKKKRHLCQIGHKRTFSLMRVGENGNCF
jgi:hypothetical protein